MNMVFRIIITSIIFALFLQYETFDRIMLTGEMRSYSATIDACHDAAVPLVTEMAEGRIVFDETKGLTNFKHALRSTLMLNSDLSPKENSIFAAPIKIVGMIFVGDDKVPKDIYGFAIYPYVFQQNVVYRGQTITVKETLYGPSVIGIIEVAYRVKGEPVTIKQAIYRYKDKSI